MRKKLDRRFSSSPKQGSVKFLVISVSFVQNCGVNHLGILFVCLKGKHGEGYVMIS